MLTASNVGRQWPLPGRRRKAQENRESFLTSHLLDYAMGCGSSKPAVADSAAPESQQQHTSSSDANAPASKHTSQKLQPIPTSSLRPVEFGLVKGLEYGEKTAPALLVVQVRSCIYTLIQAVSLLHADWCLINRNGGE